MRKTFETLTLFLKLLNEEQLSASIPVFSQLISELIEEIRSSEDYKSTETSFDILQTISSPLAKFANVYHRELPANLMEVLKIEGFLYPDQNGQYKESREHLYGLIKRGEIFKS